MERVTGERLLDRPEGHGSSKRWVLDMLRPLVLGVKGVDTIAVGFGGPPLHRVVGAVRGTERKELASICHRKCHCAQAELRQSSDKGGAVCLKSESLIKRGREIEPRLSLRKGGIQEQEVVHIRKASTSKEECGRMLHRNAGSRQGRTQIQVPDPTPRPTSPLGHEVSVLILAPARANDLTVCEGEIWSANNHDSRRRLGLASLVTPRKAN